MRTRRLPYLEDLYVCLVHEVMCQNAPISFGALGADHSDVGRLHLRIKQRASQQVRSQVPMHAISLSLSLSLSLSPSNKYRRTPWFSCIKIGMS